MMPRNNALSQLLDAGGNLVLDGALATELEVLGCDLEDPLWSAKVLLEQPDLVKRVHLDYFNAGARVAITASYQATPLGFARRGIPEAEALERVAMSVRLADEARREYLTNTAVTTRSPGTNLWSSTGRGSRRSWQPEPMSLPAKPCPHCLRLRLCWD
jgi:S-methylmethionine-dependent homocysteine/selenocysteine methylase